MPHPLPPPHRCRRLFPAVGRQCPRLGALPPPLAVPWVQMEPGKHTAGSSLKVTWWPKQILGDFSQDEHFQLKALLALPPDDSLVWKNNREAINSSSLKAPAHSSLSPLEIAGQR